MIAEELKKIIARHEMQCIELRESFDVERIETAKFGVLDAVDVTNGASGPKTGPKTGLKTGLKTELKGRVWILELIRERPKITITELIEETGLSRNGVKWNIDKLKDEGIVRRVGPAKGGHWEVVEGQ